MSFTCAHYWWQTSNLTSITVFTYFKSLPSNLISRTLFSYSKHCCQISYQKLHKSTCFFFFFFLFFFKFDRSVQWWFDLMEQVTGPLELKKMFIFTLVYRKHRLNTEMRSKLISDVIGVMLNISGFCNINFVDVLCKTVMNQWYFKGINWILGRIYHDAMMRSRSWTSQKGDNTGRGYKFPHSALCLVHKIHWKFQLCYMFCICTWLFVFRFNIHVNNISIVLETLLSNLWFFHSTLKWMPSQAMQ